MKMNKYLDQAKLMLSILPIVGQEKDFAVDWRDVVPTKCQAIIPVPDFTGDVGVTP